MTIKSWKFVLASALFIGATQVSWAQKPATNTPATNRVPISQTSTYVYIADWKSGITQYRIAKNGALTPLRPSRAQVGGHISSVVVDQAGRFAYALDNRTARLSTLKVNANGTLSSTRLPVVALAPGTSYFSLSPSGRHAVTMSQEGAIFQMFEVHPDGRLRLTSFQPAPKEAARVIAGFQPHTNQRDASFVVGYALKSNYEKFKNKGLQGEQDLPVHFALYNNFEQQQYPQPTVTFTVNGGQVQFDNSTQFIYTQEGQKIVSHRINDAKLQRTGEIEFPATLGPIFLRFHKNNRFAYALNYRGPGETQMFQCRVNEDGTLTPSKPFVAPTQGRVINFDFHPSGKFAYVTSLLNAQDNVATQFDSRVVASFAVQSDGTLKRIGDKKSAIGRSSFLNDFSPDGRFAYVLSGKPRTPNMPPRTEPGHEILQFHVEKNGELSPLKPAAVNSNYFYNMVFVQKTIYSQ